MWRATLGIAVGVPLDLTGQESIRGQVWPAHDNILSGFPSNLGLRLGYRRSLDHTSVGTKSRIVDLRQG